MHNQAGIFLGIMLLVCLLGVLFRLYEERERTRIRRLMMESERNRQQGAKHKSF